MRDHLDPVVDPRQAVPAGDDLGAAHVLHPVQDLPLEVGQVDHVVVHESERADAGGGEVDAGG